MNTVAPRHFIRHLLLTTIALAVSIAVAAPSARAQTADQTESSAATPKPKKKPRKKPAQEEPKPAPEETRPAAEESKPAPATEEAKAGVDEKKPAPEETSKGPGVDITDTREDPNERYVFVGLRYRGTVIPQFLINVFVDEGTTVFSNMFGAEIDLRKGGQSMIPWLTYADYGTGDMLFHQKASDQTIAGNWSVVHSSLKMLILGLDELWSVPIDPQQHHWDFEFGFGVGLGIVFGDLQNNWVTPSANNGTTPTNLHGSNGVNYVRCDAEGQGTGCNKVDHQNASIAKVGGYKEPFLLSGGSVPNVFPNVWFPTLGVRYKPIKQFQARLGLGFSLTGFWFGLSADYGLEKTDDKGVKASGSLQRLRDML